MVDTFKHSPLIMQNVRGTWYEQIYAFFLYYIFSIHILCLSGLKFIRRTEENCYHISGRLLPVFSEENAASTFTLKIEAAASPQTLVSNLQDYPSRQ
jgi:hypothetical protein